MLHLFLINVISVITQVELIVQTTAEAAQRRLLHVIYVSFLSTAQGGPITVIYDYWISKKKKIIQINGASIHAIFRCQSVH